MTEEWWSWEGRRRRRMTLNLTFTGMGNSNGSGWMIRWVLWAPRVCEREGEPVIIFLSEAKVSYVGSTSPMTPLMNAHRRRCSSPHCKHYKYYKFVDLLTGCQKSHSHQELPVLLLLLGAAIRQRAAFQCKSITVGRIVLHATGNGMAY